MYFKNMLIKILGAIDLLAAVVFLFGVWKYFPYQALVVLGVILMLKSLMGMLKDFASWIDIACGIALLLAIIVDIPIAISIILAVLIGQKGIISFFAE